MDHILGYENSCCFVTVNAFLAHTHFLPPPLSPLSPHCSIPTMSEMGFEDCSLYTNVWVGGETEALRRLPLYCQLRSQNTDNTVSRSRDCHMTTPTSPTHSCTGRHVVRQVCTKSVCEVWLSVCALLSLED